MSEPFDPYRKWLGIPPKDQPPNHYRLLTVELFEDDPEIISNAADRIMAHVRTFQTGPHSAQSQQLLNEIAAVRVCLLDPAQKTAYDQALRDQLLMAQEAQALASAVSTAPSPIPVAVPVPQPVLPPAGSPAAAVDSNAPAIVTDRPPRRRIAWHAPLAVSMLGATLVVTAYYLMRFQRQQAESPNPVADAVPETSEHAELNTAAGAAPERSTAEGPLDASHSASPSDASKPPAAEPVAARDGPIAPGAERVLPRLNLLKLIDPARDAVQGEWRMEQGMLVSPEHGPSRLAIPFRLPPEYQLAAVVERRSGDDAFAVGLIADVFKTVAIIDGGHGAASGLSLLDNRSFEGNDTTRLGRVMRDADVNELHYFVTKSRIRLVANGDIIVDFRGDFNRLSWPHDLGAPVPGRLELIGSNGSVFAIRALELTVLRDPYRIAGPIRQAEPAPAEPEGTEKSRAAAMEQRKTLGGLLYGPGGKPAVPSEQNLIKADRLAREQLRNELAAARLPEQKQALAQTLVERGFAIQDDVAARCAALRLASEVAADGGYVADAFTAINELARWIEADANELKLDVLARAGKAPNVAARKKELVQESSKLSEEFIKADDYAKAAKALTIGQAAARSLKDPRRLKELADDKRDVERLAKAYAALAPDLARLQEDQEDEDANLNVGRFYCLTKEQWDRGLPHLARGPDGPYRALAAKDLTMPGAAADQRELANGWWELSQAESAAAKTATAHRAGVWYRRAAPFLEGSDRQQVEQRIKETENGDAGAELKQVFLADLPEADINSDGNRLFKGQDDGGNDLKVDDRPTPKGLLVQPRANGLGNVTYIVNRKYISFIAEVGINPFPYNESASPLTFELVGDSALLWRSQPISKPGETDRCEINISKVVSLELRVACPGDNAGAKAVWIEPRLIEK